jgi:hypothetical protein
MSRVVSYTEFHAFFSLVFSPILIKPSLRLTAVPFSNNDPVALMTALSGGVLNGKAQLH